MKGLIRNGKVTKKGSVMTCIVCGGKGHNKRFHGAGTGASTRQQRRKKLHVMRKTKKQQKKKESNAENTAQNVQTHEDDQPDHVAPTGTAPLGTASIFNNLSPLILLSQLFNVTPSTKEVEKPTVQLGIPAHLVDCGDYASQWKAHLHSTTSPSKATSKKSKSINDLLSELPPDLGIGRLSQTHKGGTEAKGKKTFKPPRLLSKDVGAKRVSTIIKSDKEK
ncbi:uncharacterized protein LOC112536713 [Ricinus communis]|uniref:uncharacterized protein LOC112536713 n=1 Tax=Ricinus communis TaxID=3988 RepID=UPI00201AFEB5|nr:uncharacterized protein LOC112536713 [Ricinus communis]XP_048231770.1 uncharacterized protein LOC112536713 [Ricinus communis]